MKVLMLVALCMVVYTLRRSTSFPEATKYWSLSFTATLHPCILAGVVLPFHLCMLPLYIDAISSFSSTLPPSSSPPCAGVDELLRSYIKIYKIITFHNCLVNIYSRQTQGSLRCPDDLCMLHSSLSILFFIHFSLYPFPLLCGRIMQSG